MSDVISEQEILDAVAGPAVDAAPPVADPTPAPDTSSGAAPWTQDIDQMGLGEKAGLVDGYLRGTVQPRVTQLEQQVAEYKKYDDYFDGTETARIASAIMNGLSDPEHFRETLDYLNESFEWGLELPAAPGDEPAVDADVQPPADGDFAVYKKFMDDMIAAQAQEKNEKALNDFYSEQEEKYGDGFDQGLFEDIFLARAQVGESLEQIQERYEGQIALRTPPAPRAPQVLAGSGATPPTEADVPQDMEEASRRFAEMLADDKRG